MTQAAPVPDPQRMAGGLLGLLVGDALGVPYEFHPPEEIPPREQIEFHPPPGFHRAHWGVPEGTWSDDGAHALCLLESLLERECLDLEDLGERLVRWRTHGHMAVGGAVFDIGRQTSTALNRLSCGVPAESAGPAGEEDNGNGSLMRVLPLVLWHRGNDHELVELAARQSLVTHGHARSQICCALYCLWAREIVRRPAGAWERAAQTLRAVQRAAGLPEHEVAQVLDPANAIETAGSGYVLDTLWSARESVERTRSYEGAVRKAIAFGRDTDTTAMVAGGIAGLRYGMDAIPERWRKGLRGGTLYEPLLARLARPT